MKIPREVKLEVLRKWRRPPEQSDIVDWWWGCGRDHCALCDWMARQRNDAWNSNLHCPLQDCPENCRLCCAEWRQCNCAEAEIEVVNENKKVYTRFYEAFRAMQRRVRKLEAEEK